MEPELARGRSAAAGKEKEFSAKGGWISIPTGTPRCQDALQRNAIVLQPPERGRNKGLI